jgi:hypothetical protein
MSDFRITGLGEVTVVGHPGDWSNDQYVLFVVKGGP